jgi:hypothetical protein
MARARWSRADLPEALNLGGIFVAAGAVMGLLRGPGWIVSSAISRSAVVRHSHRGGFAYRVGGPPVTIRDDRPN